MSALGDYRKRCSFNVRTLTELIDGGKELRELKENIWETLRRDPLFSKSSQEDLTFEEQRRMTVKRFRRLQEYDFVTNEEIMSCPAKQRAFHDAINCYCTSLLLVHSLHKQVRARDVLLIESYLNFVWF